MAESENDSNDNDSVEIHIHLRSVETFHAIHALKRYVDIMEQEMPIVQALELATLDAKRPAGNDEEEQSSFLMERGYLEDLFEHDLIPTMRYSYVVFVHTILESHLRAFCAAMKQERSAALSLAEIRGSAIDQARVYLTKVIGIHVGQLGEWQDLRAFQSVRDCIVHDYGYVARDDPRHRTILDLTARNIGVAISHYNRLWIGQNFCEKHLDVISALFQNLFEEVGWE